jgi:long-chain fatty acid transport protein
MHIKHILFILLAVTSINIFSQNGTRLIGYDAKTIGRGGTSIGLFDSPVLMITNPAGISFLDKSFIEGDFSLMLPALKFENTINTETEGAKNYYPLPYAGYVQKIKKSKLTVGFGLFTNGGMGSDFLLNHSLFKDQTGNYVQQNYYSKFAVMQGGPSISYLFSKNFSAGISAHVYYSMMDFKMPYSLSPSMLKGVINPQTGMTFGDMFSAPQSQGGLGYTEVTAYSEMKDLRAFGFGGKIGLAYKFNDKVSAGLTYSLPVNLTYKNGTANMDMTYQMNDAFGRVVQGYMTNYPGINQQQAMDSATNAFSQMGINLSLGATASYELENKLSMPQSVGFGLSVTPNKQLRLAFDFEWINWKKAFEKMELSMIGGQNANINRMMGNNGSFTMDFPMNWKDSYLIHGGLEYDINKMFTIRAGYVYGTNPVPDSSVFPVFPAIVENHVTIGTTANFSKQFSTSFAFEMALNKKQTSASDNIVAEEYNNSISQLQTMLFHVLLTYKF